MPPLRPWLCALILFLAPAAFGATGMADFRERAIHVVTEYREALAAHRQNTGYRAVPVEMLHERYAAQLHEIWVEAWAAARAEASSDAARVATMEIELPPEEESQIRWGKLLKFLSFGLGDIEEYSRAAGPLRTKTKTFSTAHGRRPTAEEIFARFYDAELARHMPGLAPGGGVTAEEIGSACARSLEPASGLPEAE